MGISAALGSSALLPAGLGFRNKIINGDFRINQRAFSSTTTNGTFGLDRWFFQTSTGTGTYSRQSFTFGSPAANGFEAENFARVVSASQTGTNAYLILCQKIEDVRTCAGTTTVVSFYAKAASGTPKVAVELEQNFGSGGSPSSTVTNYLGQVTLSTSWQRFNLTFNVPSITGKTIGTTANTSFLQLNLWCSAGTDFNARTGSLGVQNNTFDFWGVQVEQNLQPTPFEQRPIGVELALCQRYYYRRSQVGGFNHVEGIGVGVNFSNSFFVQTQHPVEMRAAPVFSVVSGSTAVDAYGVASGVTLSSQQTTTKGGRLSFTSSGLTDYRPYFFIGNADVTVQFNSEL
jgi:hypothetical protein